MYSSQGYKPGNTYNYVRNVLPKFFSHYISNTSWKLDKGEEKLSFNFQYFIIKNGFRSLIGKKTNMSTEEVPTLFKIISKITARKKNTSCEI